MSPGMFAGLPVAVALVSGPDLTVQIANERFAALAGCAELAGQPLTAAPPEFCAQEVARLFRSAGTPAGRAP